MRRISYADMPQVDPGIDGASGDDADTEGAERIDEQEVTR